MDVAVSGMEIVSDLRLALSNRIGDERFDLWFGRATRLSIDQDAFCIETPDQFSLDWIRKHFRDDLEHVTASICERPLKLVFRLDAALKRHQRPPEAGTADRGGHPPVTGGPESEACDSNGGREKPGRGDQLRPGKRRFSHFNQFVTGNQNRIAFTAAQSIAESPGSVTPFLVYGPHGVGKSHLLESIWCSVRMSSRNSRCVYLSAEQFTTYFLEALQGSGLPSFRRKYRDVDLLVLDDIQFFAGKQATITEFLHTSDALLRDGRQLVFAADRPPAELAALGPEILGRMTGGLVCEVQPPDEATREELARRMAADLELAVPPSVLRYIAEEFFGDARQIRGALHRLKATVQTWGSPLSLQSAEESLQELISSHRRAVRLNDINRVVCSTFGLNPDALQSTKKSKSISQPRMLAMWLARKHTRAALTEIGQYFGRRSHSTVIAAQKRVNGWMQTNSPIFTAEGGLLTSEAIRKVEAQLKTG